MSILIRGTMMPASCSVCPCSYDNMCAITNEYPTFTVWCNDRPEWCPLVELPERHGRLIDVDELEKRLYDYGTGTTLPIDWSDIANAPTIIEAER